MLHTGMTTPLCGHCGRPVVGGAIYSGGLAYHIECTHGPSGPVSYQQTFTEERIRQIVQEELRRKP